MNYDAILAIFNCIKEKIKYTTTETNKQQEIPEEIRKWYEELKTTNNINIDENNISSIKEGTNGELCTYYIPTRETNQRVSTNSSEKEKIMNELINKSRDKMIKETIYNYLTNILNGIEFLPFDVKQQEEQSVYECKATGKDSEQIKVDYDEDTLKTNIKITTNNTHLKISLLPEIISTNYNAMLTITPTTKNKYNIKKIFSFFKQKSRFEIKNQEKAEFISITKEEIKSQYHANGTIYKEEGVYILEVTNNTFTINYFDQETINTIMETNLNKKFELTNFIKILREKKDLSNTDFIEKLEKTGLLPNANFSIPCTPKELQTLINKTYLDAKSLIKDLYKGQN